MSLIRRMLAAVAGAVAAVTLNPAADVTGAHASPVRCDLSLDCGIEDGRTNRSEIPGDRGNSPDSAGTNDRVSGALGDAGHDGSDAGNDGSGGLAGSGTHAGGGLR